MMIDILCQDLCFDKGIPIEDILAKGGIKSFVSSRFSEKISTSSALRTFDRGKLKGLRNGITTLRGAGHNVDLFFITPFGLLHSESIISRYKPCTRDLSKARLEYFLLERGTESQVRRILEEQPDILIIYMAQRLWRNLSLPQYIPIGSTTIFLSNVTPSINRNNVIFLSEKLLEERDVKTFGLFFKRFSQELSKQRKMKDTTREKITEKIRSVLRGERKKNKDLFKIIKKQ